MTQKENRRSFRIQEPVYLNVEVLTELEFSEGLERRKVRLGIDDGAQSRLVDLEARLSETMYLMGGNSEHVARCIMLLNEKLNLVVDQLPGLRQTKSALASRPPQTCEIAADGMAFGTDKPLHVGTKVHIQMLLESSNRYIETFAHVVRATEPPGSGDPQRPFGAAVEFNGMQPSVREVLIQHMFSRESETLRMRRLQIEESRQKG